MFCHILNSLFLGFYDKAMAMEYESSVHDGPVPLLFCTVEDATAHRAVINAKTRAQNYFLNG